MKRAQPGVEAALAMAVAVGAAFARPLVAPGRDQPVHVGLHQVLQDHLGEATQEVAIVGSSGSASISATHSSVIRVLRPVSKSENST